MRTRLMTLGLLTALGTAHGSQKSLSTQSPLQFPPEIFNDNERSIVAPSKDGSITTIVTCQLALVTVAPVLVGTNFSFNPQAVVDSLRLVLFDNETLSSGPGVPFIPGPDLVETNSGVFHLPSKKDMKGPDIGKVSPDGKWSAFENRIYRLGGVRRHRGFTLSLFDDGRMGTPRTHAWSPDSRYLAINDRDSVWTHIVDVQTRKVKWKVNTGERNIIEFSPDGKLLMAYHEEYMREKEDWNVRLYALDESQLKIEKPQYQFDLDYSKSEYLDNPLDFKVQFSPNSQEILIAYHDLAIVFDITGPAAENVWEHQSIMPGYRVLGYVDWMPNGDLLIGEVPNLHDNWAQGYHPPDATTFALVRRPQYFGPYFYDRLQRGRHGYYIGLDPAQVGATVISEKYNLLIIGTLDGRIHFFELTNGLKVAELQPWLEIKGNKLGFRDERPGIGSLAFDSSGNVLVFGSQDGKIVASLNLARATQPQIEN